MIYSPSDDSYLLAEALKNLLSQVKNKKIKILDMGSGSGIQAQTCIDAGFNNVLAADIGREAVSHLKSQNIKKTMCHHTLKGVVCKGTCFLDAQGTNSILNDGVFTKFLDIKSVQSNLFSHIKGKFDLIVFNPPYLPQDAREDVESRKATTGGKKGDEIILKFLKQAKSHLNKDGKILLLLSSLTPKERIVLLINRLKLKCGQIASKKLFFESLKVWELEQ